MSLLLPSRVGEGFPASYEAQENLSKLMHTDPRGGKDQVATRVALEYFKRTKDLQPGYFDGLKSWVKSSCIYVAAGTVAVGATALGVYGTWQVVTKTSYGPLLAAGLCGGAWISYECGLRPVEYLKGLLTATVRDAANRAARSSVRNDEMTWDAKASERKECRKEILNQLLAVYNDCAKQIHDTYQQTHLDNIDGRLELKQIVEQLQKRLPTIEMLLSKLELAPHEVEGVLQRLKDKVQFVQRQICYLYPKKSCERMNSELIARWAIESINEIAVPYEIKERAAAAKNCKFGMVGRASGYGSALLVGAGTLIAATAVFAGIAAGYHAYQNGISDTISKAQNLFANQNWGWPVDMDHSTMAGLGVAAFGVVGTSTAVTIKKGMDHSRASSANAEYVEGELHACVRDLKTIYDGVAKHLESLRGEDRSSLGNALKARLPSIREEIRGLGIVNDPVEILASFEQACIKIQA